MPYIKQEQRDRLDPIISRLIGEVQGPGQLNYVITRLGIALALGNKLNYASLNEVLGVLEAVKQEFYRRLVTPYENEKITENGDVYGMAALAARDPTAAQAAAEAVQALWDAAMQDQQLPLQEPAGTAASRFQSTLWKRRAKST